MRLTKVVSISGVYCFLLLACLFMQSCFLVHVVKDGETLYTEKKYTDAADKLKEEYAQAQTEPIQARKSFLLGECYRYSGQTVEAEKWYQLAASHNYDPIASYDYAIMLKANGKYDLAIDEFKGYLQDVPLNEDARRQLKATEQALDWQLHPAPYVVTNLQSINSPAFDYAPVIYKNDALVFTSDRTDASGSNTFGWTGEKFSDLFIAESDSNGGYKEAKRFSNVINSKYNEGAACFSTNFNECYFTRCGSDNITSDYCKIFYSIKNGSGEWSVPEQLNFFTDTNNVEHPCLSADGKELYFSSDAEGGFGGKDLYVAAKTSDGWGEPINLGPQINTTGDEGFPYLYEGKLYFASNGLAGMGGFDIFVATKTNKQWGNPQNLKPPINSPADDFGILWEKVPHALSSKVKAMGLFTSNRPGGKGNDDIYQFTLQKVKVYVLNGTVQEKVFENPKDPNSKVLGNAPLIDAEVSISRLDTTATPILLKTDKKGSFSLLIDAEKQYKVTASKTEYFTKSEQANSIGFKNIQQDTVKASVHLVLDKIYKEVLVNISNIYYDYNKANIRTDAALVLDTVVTLLKENPQVKVEIGSHTDSRGNAKYNAKLSQARAQSAVDYLVAHGIDISRLSAKGYGATMLTNNCGPGVKCTEEEHQKNRRTTFKVLSDTMNIESKEPEKIIQDPNKK